MSMSVIAMVPVRAGSNRVKNKNTRIFGDTNLLRLKLQLLKKLRGLSEIVVSTDCNICAKIAQNEGVKVQWRDEFYAGSRVSNDKHWSHIAETTPGDVVFLAQVTSPLIKLSSMQKALDIYLKTRQFDSINSVTSEKKFLWENGSPINYDASLTPKSQDLPEIFSLNFAITVISREIMIKRKNVVGYKPYLFELDKLEGLDIDDITDFKIAELLYYDLGAAWFEN